MEAIDIIEIFRTQEWAIRALIASSLVGIICGVLGCFLVLRNMALIGDAMSHSVLPGVVIAFLIFGYSTIGFFIGATLTGLIAAILITWVQHNLKIYNDSSIGIVYTAMFSLGVIGISKISNNPDSSVHLDLKDFLFGNPLGIHNEDIYLTLGVAIYVIFSVIFFYRYLFVTTFQPVIAETMGISVKMIHYFLMLLLSVTIVVSVQAVGFILVVAMLIIPAVISLLISNHLRWVMFFAGLIGFLSAASGLILAIIFDLPPGPAIVLVCIGLFLLTAFFSPKKGLIIKYFRKKKLQQKIQLEDTLKQALKLHQNKKLNLKSLSEKLSFSSTILSKHLKTLQNSGWVSWTNNQLSLNESGVAEANKLVRAHRLWETYLVSEIGLTEEQIHEDAEKYEHLLTEEILDEVDEVLGFPEKDPHGSPIPKSGKETMISTKNKTSLKTSKKKGFVSVAKPEKPLSQLSLLEKAKIAKDQINKDISVQLWELGILPDMAFSIHKKEENFVAIKSDQKEIKLSRDLAQLINVV